MHKKFLKIFFFLIILFVSVKGQAQAVEQIEDSLRFEKHTGTSTVQVRQVPDTTLSDLKKDDDYWYANTIPEKKKEKLEINRKKSLFEMQWFRTLMWVIIIGAFAAVVIWYLISGNILLVRRAPKKVINEEEEEISEDIFALNYEKEIQKAIANKNYRLAVRLMYLQTLKRLSEKNIIRYTHERTNSDYLTEIFNTRYYKDFFRLTRNFEYTWYGQFDLSGEAFSMMQDEFKQFKSGLN